MSEYIFKTDPRKHQLESFLDTRDRPNWALWWTMGVGKSKPTIDTMGYLYEAQKIQAAVVMAPNGVHSNWVLKEIPKHLPDRIERTTFFWTSQKAKQVGNRKQQEYLINSAPGLKILTMSPDALMTAAGYAYIKKFLAKYQCMIVVDESQFFKTPGSQRTKRLTSLAPKAKFRRCLSGTPITKGPFDVYTQVRFTKPEFWAQNRLHPFQTFKKHFGVFISREEAYAQTGFDPGYVQHVGYRNIDQLKNLLAQTGQRLTLKSAGIELPPTTYLKRPFRMTEKVAKVYRELEREHEVVLPESGDLLEVEHQIAVFSKLQQVACGYVCVDNDEPWQLIDSGSNPRLETLIDNVTNIEGKSIIWSKFNMDIDIIMERLKKEGRNPVRYDGKVSPDQRVKNIDAFQEGDATDFVAKPQSAGTGLTLTAAQAIHQYACSYNFGDRRQADGRVIRFGLEHPVMCFDYLAVGTVDELIIPNLRAKDVLSKRLLGDEVEAWI